MHNSICLLFSNLQLPNKVPVAPFNARHHLSDANTFLGTLSNIMLHAQDKMIGVSALSSCIARHLSGLLVIALHSLLAA